MPISEGVILVFGGINSSGMIGGPHLVPVFSATLTLGAASTLVGTLGVASTEARISAGIVFPLESGSLPGIKPDGSPPSEATRTGAWFSKSLL